MMLPKFSFSWGLVLWFTGFKRPLWIAVIGCRPLRVPHDVKKNEKKSPKMRINKSGWRFLFLFFIVKNQQTLNTNCSLIQLLYQHKSLLFFFFSSWTPVEHSCTTHYTKKLSRKTAYLALCLQPPVCCIFPEQLVIARTYWKIKQGSNRSLGWTFLILGEFTDGLETHVILKH